MKSFTLTTILLLFIPSVAMCQTSACNDVLQARTTEWSNLNTSEQSALLDLVDDKNYEVQQKQYKAVVPGYFDGDYKSFKDKRSERYALHSYQSSQTESAQRLRLGLADGAVANWLACIQSQGKDLFAYVSNVTESGVTIRVEWKPPSGLGDITIKADIANVTSKPEISSFTLSPNGAINFELTRVNKALEIRGPLNGKTAGNGDYATSIYVPGETAKPMPPCKQTDANGKCLVCSWSKVQFSGPAGHEHKFRCPDMAKAGNVRLVTKKVQIFQEGWPGNNAIAWSRQNQHQLTRNGDKKWSGGLVGSDLCGPSGFYQLDESVGPASEGENVELVWKVASCGGCGDAAAGSYVCGAAFPEVEMVAGK
jgi:hypothetical protein